VESKKVRGDVAARVEVGRTEGREQQEEEEEA